MFLEMYRPRVERIDNLPSGNAFAVVNGAVYIAGSIIIGGPSNNFHVYYMKDRVFHDLGDLRISAGQIYDFASFIVVE